MTTFPTKLTKTALFTICAVCWIVQSLPALFLYMDGREIVQQRSSSAPELMLPQLLLCNHFPFTQAGLSSLGEQFNRDSVLAYLRQWLDPSLGAAPPEDSLSAGLSEQDRQQAEQTIAQLLPNGRLKQRLEQLMPQCQDMVSSCVLGSRQLGGFDCCRMVQPWLATPRGGICWPFVGNLSSMQSPLDHARGMQITFQISRNSFLSSALTVHPGVDLFLVPPEMHNRLRVATTLGESFPLNDKRALRMDIRKEVETANELTTMCHPSAEVIQHGQMLPAARAGLLCMLEKAIEKCSCVPMLVVLWTLQNDLDSTFLRRFNASTICTVGEFDHCVRPYIEFAIPPGWTQYEVPENGPSELRDGLDECRRKSAMACQNTRFPSKVRERDLPAEYRNTQDFVSRISVSYDSFVVTEVSIAKQMDLYQLLSTIGLNLWWFAIGHLLWSICRFRCVASHSHSGKGGGGSSNRVEPKSPMIPPMGAQVPRPSVSQGSPRQHQGDSNLPPQNQQQPPAPSQGIRPLGGGGGGGARQLPPLAIAPPQNAPGNGVLGSAVSAFQEGTADERHSVEEER